MNLLTAGVKVKDHRHVFLCEIITIKNFPIIFSNTFRKTSTVQSDRLFDHIIPHLASPEM
jgi:hypothetical protein